ncbi:MAG: hypothetical protein IBJ19_15485 [Gemmatimonadaceae bacterium]|nr:hypothetical protein [Gemmatimonadaceae bacterium]
MFQPSAPVGDSSSLWFADSLRVALAAAQDVSGESSVASTFTERLAQSFSLLGEFVPALFGALVILFAGYLVAKVVEKGTTRLLRRVKFNQLLERGGVVQAVERSGSHLNPAKVLANLLFWVVMFAVLMIAASAIGLDSLANVFTELVSYIPSVIAAIVIIILGIVLGGFVGGLIMASAGGLYGGPWLARIGRGGVIVLAVFMALQELGIATDIVTTAFAILFGAVALALALSFGLGNRELAGQVTREWYERYQAERRAIDAEAAAEEAEELAEATSEEAAEAAEAAAQAAKAAAKAAAVQARSAAAGSAAQGGAAHGGAAHGGAALLVVLGLLPWPTPATAQAAPARATQTAVSDSAREARLERARLEAETEALYGQLNALRRDLLTRADWAELGDRCNPGALRVFSRDTTPAQRDSVQAMVERMESIIVNRGVGARLDTPEARRLLRVIVGWEAGIDRPFWDELEPAGRAAARPKLREAVATGMTGEVPDPQGPGCLPSPLASDTVTFVLPGFSTMDFPRAPKPRVKAYFGPEAQRHARDEFYAAVGRNRPEAELSYMLVAPVVIWRDYALVAVRRPVEPGGVILDAPGRGGAVYLMRRSGMGATAEWRLVTIVRTWGA